MERPERNPLDDSDESPSQSLSLATLHPPENVIRRLTSLDLYYNEWPEAAILCIKCAIALKTDTDRVSRHLDEKHGVSKQHRRGLNELVRSLSLPDPEELRLRPDGSEPHRQLVQQAGYSCVHCNKRSSSVEVISRHLKEVHGSELLKKKPQQDVNFGCATISNRISFSSCVLPVPEATNGGGGTTEEEALAITLWVL